SGIHRRPRYHSPAYGADHDQCVARRRKDRGGSAEAHHFTKERDSGRQRGVGCTVPQVLFGGIAPRGNCRCSGRAPEGWPRPSLAEVTYLCAVRVSVNASEAAGSAAAPRPGWTSTDRKHPIIWLVLAFILPT